MAQVFTVPDGTPRGRADKVIAGAFPDHSRTEFQRAFDDGLVMVGGKPIKRKHPLSAGDTVEFAFTPVAPSRLVAVKIPLEVIFEDKHVIAINKASGMTVHPGTATGEDTLVHALLAHCKGGLSGIGGVERPGIVHRIDRETSGVIIVAKNDKAHRGLSEQFARRTVQKEYLALVTGVPTLLSGSIRKPIGRNTRQRHKMTVVELEEGGGRDAHTDWEVVESFGKVAALLRCTIHTGRTHQIRVHLKSIGHAILGDRVYGWKQSENPGVTVDRVMLHAEHLVVLHPITGKVLDLRASLPKDFEVLGRRLKTFARRAKADARPSGVRNTDVMGGKRAPYRSAFKATGRFGAPR